MLNILKEFELTLSEGMTNNELIEKAADVVKILKTKQGLFGHVGSALICGNDEVFVGICADVNSGSLCAARNAIGSMITQGNYRIKKIVSVWVDANGETNVMVPCIDCRKFMLEVNNENFETEIILGPDKTILLEKLLPKYN